MTELNADLNRLLDNLDEQPQISVTYFVLDEKKSGGKYVEMLGVVRIYDSNVALLRKLFGQCFDLGSFFLLFFICQPY